MRRLHGIESAFYLRIFGKRLHVSVVNAIVLPKPLPLLQIRVRRFDRFLRGHDVYVISHLIAEPPPFEM
jgi:hypothetical protein